jgi:hypothetical protein
MKMYTFKCQAMACRPEIIAAAMRITWINLGLPSFLCSLCSFDSRKAVPSPQVPIRYGIGLLGEHTWRYHLFLLMLHWNTMETLETIYPDGTLITVSVALRLFIITLFSLFLVVASRCKVLETIQLHSSFLKWKDIFFVGLELFYASPIYAERRKVV